MHRKLIGVILASNFWYAPVAFADINTPTNFGGAASSIAGISADGSVTAGYFADPAAGGANRAFRLGNFGLQNLGVLNTGTISQANGLSADSLVVVGSSNPGGQNRAFRWTQAGGMINLGTLPGGDLSVANGANADGSVVVGYSSIAGGAIRAFRWTQAGGMVDLGTLGGGTQAYGTNADGSVVVGSSNNGVAFRAFRWTQAGGMVNLGTLGGVYSEALGVNADGSVVVGIANTGVANRAFRWTQAGGMVNLGVLAGGGFSIANAVNTDGSVVVGTSSIAGGANRAFRWTQASGMQTVEDWLRANGVTVPADITAQGRAVSADGSIVVGQLANNQAFIARVVQAAPNNSPNTPQLGSGLITLEDKFNSLATIIPVPVLAAEAEELVINGIHGHPLNNRIQQGNTGFWLGGDWGGEHASRDGIAEVGLSRKIISTWQAGLGLGKTFKKQKLNYKGKQQFNGVYVLAELMGELPIKNLWLTLDGLCHRGHANNTRGYINAGALDSSVGRTQGASKAFRIRLDQDKFIQFKALNLTPYAQYAASYARQKAYTELGGGFPSYFNAKRQRVREARIGINSELLIWKQLTLLGTIEGVRRFEKTGPSNTGGVLGLFDFSIPGRKYDQNWLRGSVGLQSPLAGGIAALTLNATTPGEDNRMWVGLSYHLNFDTIFKSEKEMRKLKRSPYEFGMF